ncbi:MAG: hypothetical protein ACE5PV_26820 [Candidatus Poribacteria bacterium]
MKKRKRKIVFFSVGFFFVLIVGAVLVQHFQNPQDSHAEEVLVAENVILVPLNMNATDVFNYAGESVGGEMTSGCYVPATMRLTATRVDAKGTLRIYMNDQYVGYCVITSTGAVAIASGCGCATTCICEIRTGDNMIKFESLGFSGEVKYEVTWA